MNTKITTFKQNNNEVIVLTVGAQFWYKKKVVRWSSEVVVSHFIHSFFILDLYFKKHITYKFIT